ncbi:MAG: hypothetical protein V4719_13220 [Planctomycetota bacterium]
MRFRFPLPIAELLVVVILAGVIAVAACVWNLTVPGDDPLTFGSKDLRVIGTRLYTSDGRLRANWVPGEHGQPGHWKSVPLEVQQLPFLQDPQ